jgi:2,3-bisphosphoglycerate-independent phosphoglycerate mutase
MNQSGLCSLSLSLSLSLVSISLNQLSTAALVNELSQVIQERLSTHPLNIERAKKGLPVANVVLLRGCGARIQVTLHFGIRGVKTKI